MSRQRCATAAAGLLGLAVGLLLVALLLGAQLHRYEPGLWTLRFQRILDCGIDYNGPPYAKAAANLWLTCGAEDRSWRLWPPWAQ
jgi:hypothetical protein